MKKLWQSDFLFNKTLTRPSSYPDTVASTVGYDDRKMVLGGQFDYEEDNQRALPFNVKITEINEEMKVHRGSTSKSASVALRTN